MSGFEVNKILAAIFVALIIFFIIGQVGNKIVNIEPTDTKEIAYKIEIQDTDASSISPTTSSGEHASATSEQIDVAAAASSTDSEAVTTANINPSNNIPDYNKQAPSTGSRPVFRRANRPRCITTKSAPRLTPTA